jgi:outer membrane protein W
MIRYQGLLAGLLVLSGAATALAEDSTKSDQKLSVGLRLGYALRAGKASEYVVFPGGVLAAERPGEHSTRQIPIWLDAGYFVTTNAFVGIYAQYGFASDNDCLTGASCSAHDIRLGLQVQYHLMARRPVDPWLGLGVGYEWLSDTRSGGGITLTESVKGIEFANLQGGADFAVARAFTLGPFLSASFGQYSNAAVGESDGREVNVSFNDKTFHEWFALGIRGSFELRASAPRPEIDAGN